VQTTDPEYVDSRRWIARSLEQAGNHAQALEFLVRSLESSGDGSEAILRAAFESGGWPAVLRASLPRDQQQVNLESAGTLAQLGEEDQAFDVLERMVSARRVMITHMDSDPRLDPLRTDPRFELIARRVGLR
jgi:hypothetical protein